MSACTNELVVDQFAYSCGRSFVIVIHVDMILRFARKRFCLYPHFWKLNKGEDALHRLLSATQLLRLRLSLSSDHPAGIMESYQTKPCLREYKLPLLHLLLGFVQTLDEDEAGLCPL